MISSGVFLYFVKKIQHCNYWNYFVFCLPFSVLFINKYLFIKFISKCQNNILSCTSPLLQLCDFLNGKWLLQSWLREMCCNNSLKQFLLKMKSAAFQLNKLWFNFFQNVWTFVHEWYLSIVTCYYCWAYLIGTNESDCSFPFSFSDLSKFFVSVFSTIHQ